MRRFIALILLLALAGVAAWMLVYNTVLDKQELQIVFVAPQSGASIEVYKKTAENAPLSANIDSKNLVETVSSDGTVKLRKGDYVWKSKAPEQYEEKIDQFSMQQTPVKLEIKLKLKQSSLSDILKQQSDAIHASVRASLPSVGVTYEIASERLFEQADWYAATLTPKSTAEQKRTNYYDTFRVIAHKEGTGWVLITKPPELLLSSQRYPNIPFAVLSEANKMTAN